MLRNIDLNEISDGNLYTSNDLVRADCGGCRGCSDCCQGMGDSIILDPYDMDQLYRGTGLKPEELLLRAADLSVVDGIILPHLKMTGKPVYITAAYRSPGYLFSVYLLTMMLEF